MVVQVTFQPSGRRVQVKKGDKLLEAVQVAGEAIRSICGGKGTCGKCKVIIEKGEVSDVTPAEKHFLSDEDLSAGYRLACQTRIFTDAVIGIPPETRMEGQKILVKASIPESELNPPCKKNFISQDRFKALSHLKPSQLLIEAAKSLSSTTPKLSPSVLERLSAVPTLADKGLTLTVCEADGACRIVDVQPEDTSSRNFGLAIDIGTTKIVIYLVNLRDGKIVDSDSGYNKQLVYGEDLLSRIDYAFRRENGLQTLQKAVLDGINGVSDVLLSRNAVSSHELTSITASGNTVMTHLLVGLDTSYLVRSDVPVSRDPIDIKAGELGIKAAPEARIFCLPSVSRFVGGDAVADVVTSGLYASPEISFLIDMGTNGEIILGSKGWILSTSCASGPAFEGWGIRFGMRAVQGAVEHVRIDRNTLKPTYTVIGGSSVKPRGICGSGMIDAMAEMFRTGIIDSFGKIRKDLESPFVRQGPDGLEYLIAPEDESGIGRDITITGKDLYTLMDSKAAACGAIAVLMRKVKLTVHDIQNLYLAGAFGSYIDVENATKIGVFPEFPNAKTTLIGNGSAGGAYLTLISTRKRLESEQIARDMTYYDLTVDIDFMEEYEAAFMIPGRKGLFPTLGTG